MSDLTPREYQNPYGVFNRYVKLTDDAIIFGKPPGDSPADVSAAAERGERVRSILLERMTRVRANRRSFAVEVTTGRGRHARSLDLEMFDDVDQEAFFKALKTQLGSGWTQRHVEQTRWRASVAPLIALAVVMIVTYVGVLSAQSTETVGTARRYDVITRAFSGLTRWLGSDGVLIVGGVAALGCAVALIAHLRQPPIFDELRRCAVPRTG